MFKKYKQLLIGFILGAIIFTAIPISAAIEKYVLTKAPYKILINGTEYKNDAQPALNYNGNTYVPLRNLGKLLGQEPKWNSEKKQVEISIAQSAIPTEAADSQVQDSTPTPKPNETLSPTPTPPKDSRFRDIPIESIP